jgi:IS605 OrfB family transposase
MLTTWKYRIKDSGATGTFLCRMAREVNTVWNYCKEAQIEALRNENFKIVKPSGEVVIKRTKTDPQIYGIKDSKASYESGHRIAYKNFLTDYDLNSMTSGYVKEEGVTILATTVQEICKEYATRTKQFRKTLRWRGRKSSGYIPFKGKDLKFTGNDTLRFNGRSIKLFKDRQIPSDAQIKNGRFSQDARGRWYLSVTFETESLEYKKGGGVYGVDLGIKTMATLSDGSKIDRVNLRAKFLERIKRIELTRKYASRKASKNNKYGRLPKQKQMQNLHAQAKNQREYYLHKKTAELVERSSVIVVGDVPPKLMNRSKNLSGISYDTGLGMFKNMLRYKAERAGAVYVEASERNSTQTCSKCGWKHPLRIGLGVRIWKCGGCGVEHDRDVNAAKNILATYLSDPVRCSGRRPAAPKKRRARETDN